MKSQRLSLLTTSCKGYEDVLDIHEKLYAIHWKDCPYKRYLVMDEVTPNADYLASYDEVIVTGRESGKKNHSRINIALKKITTPYVIFVQEDMLLYDKVNVERIEHLVDIVERDKLGALRLTPFYSFDVDCASIYDIEENLVQYPVGTPYRVSYVPSIWNRDFLAELSRPFEYGADFERKGSALSDGMTQIMAGYKYVAYPYINAIWRGKWEGVAVEHLGYYKIVPDFTNHSLMNSKDILKQGLMGYIYNINPKLILKIQNSIKIGKSY